MTVSKQDVEREAAIRDRLAKATQGEWHADATCGDENVVRFTPDDDEDETNPENPGNVIAAVPLFLADEYRRDCDTQFIANAPADLRWALGRIDALQNERDALVSAVKWALGEEGDFASPPDELLDRLLLGRAEMIKRGMMVTPNRLYWWRSELRARAFPSTDTTPAEAAVQPSLSESPRGR
jgi:hypothetical protein